MSKSTTQEATMEYVHPSQMTDEQRREANASMFDRIAQLHERVAAEGTQPEHQKACAASARRAAKKIRNGVKS